MNITPRHSRKLHIVTRCLITLSLMTTSLTASAGHVDPPNPNSINAVRAFVGDPLWGLSAGEPGALFSKNADSPAGEASTTKSWAIHLGTRAVNQGLVDYNQQVTISSNALIPRAHGHSNMGGTTPAVGDIFLFKDMLHAAMIPSASDGILAFAEAVAQAVDPTLTTGAQREALFVDMMNQHAQDIGLVDTVFFNPYGGDHTHNTSGGTGTSVNHVTTAREMAMWFSHAMAEDDLFREVFGFRGVYSYSDVANTKNYVFNNWNPGYPGLLGQKGGSNASCNTCYVGQASRIGRELVATYMQANTNGDGTTLFDYGYQTTFHPDYLASSAKQNPVKQQALAVVANTRAVSAVVTPTGKADLITWKLDMDAGVIQKINHGFAPPCNKLGLTGNTPPPPPGRSITGLLNSQFGQALHYDSLRSRTSRSHDRADARQTYNHRGLSLGNSGPPRTPPGLNLGTSGPPRTPPGQGAPGSIANALVRAVDIVHAGDGNLVLATETSKGITLSSWGMPACGKVFPRDAVAAVKGSRVQLAVLNPGLIAVGAINSDGDLEVQTWSLDLVTGQFAPGPIDTALSQDVAEFDLASRQQVFLTSQLVAAVKTSALTNSQLRIVAWNIDSNGGNILSSEIDTIESASAISITNVTGFDGGRGVYATAYRRSNGNLRIRVHTVSVNGDLTRVGDIDSTTMPISSDGATAIASYDKRGIMLLLKNDVDNQVTNMTIWSLDDDILNAAIDVNFVVASPTNLALGQPVIARIPGTHSEGDFLIGQLDFFEFNKPLQMEAWRSGARP